MSSQEVHRRPTQSLSQLLSQRPLAPISTSIDGLNRSLNGGFIPGFMYEVSSLNGTGRSQFREQVCLNTLLMKRKVLCISCAREFQTQKIKELLDKSLFESLVTIRISTLAKLYLYLQCVLKKEHYGLVIIEDLSIILNKNMGDLSDLLSETISNQRKKTNLIELKKNKSLQDIFKLLNSYSTQNKSVICLLNPVEPINMPFVEVPNPHALPTSSTPNPSSSSSAFSSQEPFRRPKVFYQQVLTSALGHHPSWSSFIRARLTLYNDWVIGNSKKVTFVHVKHNPAARKLSQFNSEGSVSIGPISFEVSDTFGIKEVDYDHIGRQVDEMNGVEANCRTLDFDGEEFEFSDFEAEEDSHAEESGIETENSLLPSSPHHQIRTSKDILQDPSSTISRAESSLKEKDKDKDVEPVAGPLEETDEIVHTTIGKTFEEMKEPKIMSSEMTNESTLDSEGELDEMNDELEELYPTQPDILTIEELTQLSQSMLQNNFICPKKRKNNADDDAPVFANPKLVRIEYETIPETQEDSLGYITSSAPFF